MPGRHNGGSRGRGTLRAALLAGMVSVAGVAAAAPALDTTKRILVLPSLQWNDSGVAWNYATQQAPDNLARVTGGLTFGLTPEEVSRRLPDLGANLHWSELPVANEFSEDVRYVWIPMQTAGALRAPVTACFGEPSYVVLLFLHGDLFRISWRFLPDRNCPNPHAAAEELYASYVPLATTVAFSAHYRTGFAEVVDVTEPGARSLIEQRWQMRGQ
ncbi:MAG TPA: hypothetical protein VND19_01870 [Acetobacteraceae bacterium]|nr:hypothetical protein [Acetobacteraceae bacterium]